MKTAIILLSEQTLPNVLFLKQFGPFERYIFLTTSKMKQEGRSDWVMQAAGIASQKVKHIVVDSENANASLEQLANESFDPDTPCLLNLTGGTKMMALAAYAHFAALPQVQIIYLPIGSDHFLEISPEPKKIQLTATLSIDEYFAAHGIVIRGENSTWLSDASEAYRVYEHVTGRMKNQSIPSTHKEIQSPALTPKQRRFYGGDWLEVWLANTVHKELEIPLKDIRVGIKLNRQGIHEQTSNEYDVLFMYKNRLYTGEAKRFVSDKFEMDKINKELFKFAAIHTQLGLFAKPFFVIANDIGSSKEALTEQCKMLRLPYPADLSVIADKEKFKTYLRSLL